ncbi:MAG: exodeoxyribonuclease-5, partial [Polaromonas sp.]
MSLTAAQFSEDQAEAYDQVATALAKAGVDLLDGSTEPPSDDQDRSVLAVIGKAGSGKTALLARLAQDLEAAGVKT